MSGPPIPDGSPDPPASLQKADAPHRPALFDTHTHLNDPQFDPDRGEVLQRCAAQELAGIVEIADEPGEWENAIRLSRARPLLVRCSLGLHPYYAAQWSPEVGEQLLRMSKLPEVVAAGEIGLDYVKSQAPPAVQQETFRKMLDAAEAAGLPVVIHCRGAYPDLLEILTTRYATQPPTGKFRGVLHCFSADTPTALAAVQLGFALGVDGPITYPKNDALRQAISAAGLDSLVLETDSPYLPPQSCRGKRNDPSRLAEIANRVVELFGVSPEEVAQRTTENARRLFRLSDSSSGSPGSHRP